MARPCKCRCICSMPKITKFGPTGKEDGSAQDPVLLGVDEYEVIRLIDYVGFSQDKCAKRMHVARTTVARMYENARRKMAEAIVLGKELTISGGEITLCEKIRPECINEPNCCHRNQDQEN